jgi:hypothetical protein
MKTRLLLSLFALCAFSLTASRAADATKPAERIGVYDSRVVSYAHFWSEPASKERNALVAAGKSAKAAGDQARARELEQKIVAAQLQSKLEVFSTAPADEAMAALRDRLPALHEELGVTRFVSQWDEAALKGVPDARRLDATDRLVRELLPQPEGKQQKAIAEMKKAKPVPLAEARKKFADGKF